MDGLVDGILDCKHNRARRRSEVHVRLVHFLLMHRNQRGRAGECRTSLVAEDVKVRL